MEKLGTIALSPDILTKSNIGLWAFELDEGSEPRMYVDDAMLKLIGLEHQISPEETYHAWYDHIDPEHYDEVAASVEKMTAGIHAEVQYPWHHPNGEVWIVRCGGVRNYAYSRGVRIEGTHQNVTDIAHFEKKRIEQLQAIIESMSEDFECLLHVDFDTDEEEHYRVSESISNEIEEWVNEKSYSKRARLLAERLVLPEDREAFIHDTDSKVVDEHLKDGKPYILHYRIRLGDEVKWFRFKYVHHKAHGDKNCAIVGVADNDEAMHQTMRDRAIVEALGEDFSFISCINPITFKENIVRADASYAEISSDWADNKTYQDRIDMITNEFVHPKDRQYFKEETDLKKLATDLSLNATKYVNFRILYKGKTIYYQCKFVLVEIDGIKNVVIGYKNVDIETCERLAYQEELKIARKKAEAASNAKSKFLFNMSHDIRTPMNAIVGFANMALSHIDDKNKVVDCLNKVSSSSKYLLSLVNDILDMARIESGKVQCEYVPSNIIKEAENLMEMIKETTNKNIKLNSDFSDIKHNFVLADRLHVNTIITNIISNSVKYTPDGGTISYTIKEKTTDRPNFFAYDFVIEDNGIGMSREFKEHIFEAFEREKTSTISGVQGTGLGMAITKNLVENLGGTIAIESEIDKGTKVVIHLVMEAVDSDTLENDVETESLDLSVLKGKRVLLVEDNELNREIALDLLEDLGIIAEIAVDGKQAVEKCESKIEDNNLDYYDLILMDIQMPVMDGYDATRVIRSLTRGSKYHVPIIAMTANAFEEDKRASLEAGMDSHLTKPIDNKELIKSFFEFFSRKNK